MARTTAPLILAALAATLALPAAHGDATPSPAPSPTPAGRHQDEKFQRNLKKWKSLSPERQADLRKSEEFRRKRIIKEINEAIAQSGLHLDEEQRQMFTYRYAQKRRSIEENLRQELEKKRRNAVDKLLKELVTEFQATQTKATPAASPGSEPSAKSQAE